MKPSSISFLLFLSRAPVVTPKCQVSWNVGCGRLSATSNVTFYVLGDSPGANVGLEYDADVVFRWGPTDDADLGARTYPAGEVVEHVESHEYDAEGEYYVGYSVAFGEGSGSGCDGRVFQGYSLLTFDDATKSCGFGPTVPSVPRASTDPPTIFPTKRLSPPPSKRPTIRPRTPSPSKMPTAEPSVRPTSLPSKKSTSRPTTPATNTHLISQQPSLQFPPSECGDQMCSAAEHASVCPADCAGIFLEADLEGSDGYVDALGTMFSVRSDRHVVVMSVDVFFTFSHIDKVEVYFKEGGYGGHESDGGEWTAVYNNFNDLEGSTTLNLNNGEGVPVRAGSGASFYIYTKSLVRCRQGTGAGDALVNDDVLEVYQGIELNEKWNSTGDAGGDVALGFRGAFRYDIVESTPTAAPAVRVDATAAPADRADVGGERTSGPAANVVRPAPSAPTASPAGPSPTTSPATGFAAPPLTTPATAAIATGGTASPASPISPDSTTSPADEPPTPSSATVRMREYKVSSKMVFHHSERLDADSEKIWVVVTTQTILNEAAATIGTDSISVEVEVELDRQYVSEQVRMLGAKRDAGDSSRGLQSSSPPLQIQFDTTIRFPSEEDDWDANRMVASGFQSPAQQKNYINSLQQAEGGSYFERLESMSIEMDEDLVTEAPSTSPGMESPVMDGAERGSNSNDLVGGTDGGIDNKMKQIIAAVAGGACAIVLFAVAIGMYYAKRKKSGESKRTLFPHTEATQDHHLLEIETKSDTLTHPANYIGTIESKEEVDDVSTLGDPYMGDAINAVMDNDHTVGESMVSSQQDLYVYGVRRPNMMDSSQCGKSTINSGSYVRNNAIFGEDATLEDIYRSPRGNSASTGGDCGSGVQCHTVVAPAGKLGIVLDNPHGDLPIVWAIRETSLLNGKIRVGDVLLSVDGVDCRGMSTQTVSTFLSSRSQNPSRTLMLARGSDMAGV